jgi:glycine cleavage system aminomethyltransferase T
VGVADLSWTVKFDLKGYGMKTEPDLGPETRAWRLGPQRVLATCQPEARDGLLARIGRLQESASGLMLAPPVSSTDVTSVYAEFLVAGPRSRDVLRKLSSLNVSGRALPNLSCGMASVAHIHGIVLREDLGGLPAFHLLVGRDYGESLWDSVLHAGHEYHIAPFGARALRELRS